MRTFTTAADGRMKEILLGVFIVETKKNLHHEGADKKKEEEETGMKERTTQMQLAVVEVKLVNVNRKSL